MTLDIIDIRRLFRNRLECYMDKNDSTGAGFLDGSSLTFRDVCRILASDDEPFPRRYNLDMKKLCGHEYLTWFREDRSYGNVTRIFARLFAADDGLQPPVGGRWVHEVLISSRASDFWLRSDKELAYTLAEME
ncbi:hypothetical protein [Phyllobacterium endophyticum]|uniref:hypothetical protein n=1 Tax=Phyllobacterium endophyticum TaxID=1149773 RepID=UPI0011CC9893|nr:hypothetical protein [Phyllobacterium endophyticum]TXR50086.1 hypothetical protein FVA77_06790 [Phyllobacterium endophyticum]